MSTVENRIFCLCFKIELLSCTLYISITIIIILNVI